MHKYEYATINDTDSRADHANVPHDYLSSSTMLLRGLCINTTTTAADNLTFSNHCSHGTVNAVALVLASTFAFLAD